MKNTVPPTSSSEDEEGRSNSETRSMIVSLDQSVVFSEDEENTLYNHTISISSPASWYIRGSHGGPHCDAPMVEDRRPIDHRAFVTLEDGCWFQPASTTSSTSAQNIGTDTTAATLFLDGDTNDNFYNDDVEADTDELIDALNRAIQINNDALPPGGEPNLGTLCRD